jgi:hypothetical protein
MGVLVGVCVCSGCGVKRGEGAFANGDGGVAVVVVAAIRRHPPPHPPHVAFFLFSHELHLSGFAQTSRQALTRF